MPSFTVFKGSKEGKIVQSTTTKPDLFDDQVLIKVTASGLCGTDEHYLHADQGLGHEGVGTVEATGPAVKSLKKGDRVGWGYITWSCGQCSWCLTGRDQYCEQAQRYGEANHDQGSFSSHAVWNESHVFRVPDNITDAEAAPLMCGGATIWTALHSYGIKSTDRVGVMGVGGLGHLAIQFAAKMGCEVVVLSSSDAKKEESMKLGASEFIATKGKDKLEISKKLNVLIVTTSFNPDWKQIIPILSSQASIFPLTVDMGDFAIPQLPLILNGYNIYGSAVASRPVHNSMLKFAAHHQIKPVNMEFPMTVEGITKAMDTLRDGKMKYRGVLIPVA
ncbi:GroES-like protein [Massarina eburnea CBS 473.64]|uniref:GroES-like protein n=1 Tax=Massarina eburnea CBS 473.64 TaxID=1395130 RepID=A0A6A6RIX9_9PLEO|nr:GroES-like protein [Massarina eburnea CBS 473.64]